LSIRGSNLLDHTSEPIIKCLGSVFYEVVGGSFSHAVLDGSLFENPVLNGILLQKAPCGTRNSCVGMKNGPVPHPGPRGEQHLIVGRGVPIGMVKAGKRPDIPTRQPGRCAFNPNAASGKLLAELLGLSVGQTSVNQYALPSGTRGHGRKPKVSTLKPGGNLVLKPTGHVMRWR
jgi:hypothetical protein